MKSMISKAVVQRARQLFCGILRAPSPSGCTLESICKVNHRGSCREIDTRDCNRRTLKWPSWHHDKRLEKCESIRITCCYHPSPLLFPISSRSLSSPSLPLLSTSLFDVFSNIPFSFFSPFTFALHSTVPAPFLHPVFFLSVPLLPSLFPPCPVADGLTSDC